MTTTTTTKEAVILETLDTRAVKYNDYIVKASHKFRKSGRVSCYHVELLVFREGAPVSTGVGAGAFVYALVDAPCVSTTGTKESLCALRSNAAYIVQIAKSAIGALKADKGLSKEVIGMLKSF